MSDWKYFTREEFTCHCGCGENKIEDDFIDKFEELRSRCGFALIVSSGYRCPDYNEVVSTTGREGPHTTGRAGDIAISHQQALVLLRHALWMDFTGFGINQKGGSRFVHLDDLSKTPRPHVWTY